MYVCIAEYENIWHRLADELLMNVVCKQYSNKIKQERKIRAGICNYDMEASVCDV